jgi:hypothetical protein
MISRRKFRHQSDGFAPIEAFIALASCIVVILIGLFVFHSDHHQSVTVQPSALKPKSSTTLTKNTNSYAVLSPATVPSKTAECSQPLSYASDGDSGPIQCASGDLNTLEWNALSALEPSVMSLGYDASETEVQTAICNDASDSDSDANTDAANVIETTTYQISALYYGWSFATNPSAALGNGSC